MLCLVWSTNVNVLHTQDRALVAGALAHQYYSVFPAGFDFLLYQSNSKIKEKKKR